MAMHKIHTISTPTPLPSVRRDTLHVNGYHAFSRRSATPNGRPVPANAARLMNSIEGDLGAEENPRLSVFRDLYARSEARISSLFGESRVNKDGNTRNAEQQDYQINVDPFEDAPAPATGPPRKPTRKIDEDDYDESEDEEDEEPGEESPLKAKSMGPLLNLAPSSSAMARGLSSSSTPASAKGASSTVALKTTEEARKRLEEDKKATEDAAKRSFHTLFYTLENDRDAMLEQKKLEESERQVDIEMDGAAAAANNLNGVGGNAQHGTLSQTNLGASSLTLKNLIWIIDKYRDKVNATDAEIRALMSEVRKNRSRWASEEKVGQEELYEAAEKVLNELRGMTEHSGPFLTKVNKKEAPDYGNVVKHPMDLGTMTKKLKMFAYKSKHDFVEDLNLIWQNCLKYNANPEHFLRKKALFMRRETEKLVPLIPNITIRDRAEVEAEERRLQNGDINMDGDEDSDDEPIISSRGRKAPSKKAKKGTTARKAPAGVPEGSPAAEAKPSSNSLALHGLGSNLRSEQLRAESESVMDGSQKDLSTPPPGTITPAGINGILGQGAQSDGMDIDVDSSINGIIPSIDGPNEEAENDDLEYKTWKQVTKKDRAQVTAERHRLFLGDHLNPEEPALRRTKLGMRRWLKNQKQAVSDGVLGKKSAEEEAESRASEDSQPSGETLAEGMEGEEERVLPDYYDALAAIPDITNRLQWLEDSDGNVQDPSGEYLRILPPGLFTSPESNLTRKIDKNLRQIQETRKVTSKIGIVKQMQLQSQMYQGQFQKHEPAPFVEQDIEATVISEDGPPMAPSVSRAALQRSAAKLLVHAGFEEFQPSALDALTEMAGDYFTKLARTLNEYSQAPQVAIPMPGSAEGKNAFKQRFTPEEMVLHTLQENGADLDALDSYVTEEVDRAGSKLAVTHDRMKAHLADSLRPALTDGGPDGANAFNDNSEQFVGGDFAEDLGEDFFGFKDLGLDKEFNMATLSVPLHLLQNRMRSANQAQNPSALSSTPLSDLPPPLPLNPVTITNIKNEIGLVHDFFLAKLHANSDEPLVEDDDLPQKQRFPKPRLPPTGKITSPRKRPLKEQGPGKGHPRKKMKLADGEAKDVGKETVAEKDSSNNNGKEGDKDKDKKDGMQTPAKNPTTVNGVVSNGTNASAAAVVDRGRRDARMGTPTPKGKGKSGNEGGMISPESLGAT